MRRFVVFAAVFVFVAATAALAVPSGKVLEFKGSPMGVVKFDGTLHKQAVTSCKDCHVEGLFPEKKLGAVKITMKEINEGRLCGVCHNGKKAFEAKANCERCHHKPAK